MAQRIEEHNPDRPVLEMTNISKSFGATVALDQVSLSICPGKVQALVGENGAGKSTLMKILSGALKPDSGIMHLGPKVYQPANTQDGKKSGIMMIYQELSLAPHMSVEDNIMLGAEPSIAGVINRKKVRNSVVEALNCFNHIDISPRTKIHDLSPAACQLVEICRAIVFGCRILVLDEPTSSLNSKDVDRLFEIIKQLTDKQIAVIYISHVLEEVRRIADEITILRDGKTVHRCDTVKITNAEIIRHMVGRNVEQLYPRSLRKPGQALLEVDNLSGRKKPKDVSLTLHRGEIVGIAGLMGAGRTELLRAIFGLEPVSSGKVRVGCFTGPQTPAAMLENGAGLLSENRKEEGLAISMTVADNLTLTRLDRLGTCGTISPNRQKKAAAALIEKVGIKAFSPFSSVESLSGGNQQKIALGRLLYHEADILLLDEPTRGIDVAAKSVIYQIIDELACGSSTQSPKAVLVVSSYLPELLGICDRIAVMCKGKLGKAYNVKDIDEHRLMLEATG